MAKRDENYSTMIRLCTGQMGNHPGTEPYPYSWGESSMSEGQGTIHKIFSFTVMDGHHFEGTASQGYSEYPDVICPAEVFYAKGFPARNERLTDLYGNENKWYRKYHYTGNGTLSHVQGSEVWVYDAEYTTANSALEDDDRTDEDDNTDPWNRKPWNVSLDFPEVVKPFRYAYDSNNRKFSTSYSNVQIIGGVETTTRVRIPTNPVVNTAGDRIMAQTTKYDLQLSFTYALRPRSDLDITTIRSAQGSVNKKEIKLCGLRIPAESGRIVSLKPELILEDTDASGNKRQSYWEIQAVVQILADPDDTFNTKLLNTGSRALFNKNAKVNPDGTITGNVYAPHQGERSAIYRWLSFPSTKYGQMHPNSQPQFGSLKLMLMAKEMYKTNVLSVTPELGAFSYEEVQDIPLDEHGIVDLDAMDQGNERFGKYKTLEFREYKLIDWNQNSIFKQVSGSGGKLKW